jgi:hypothetical protein
MSDTSGHFAVSQRDSNPIQNDGFGEDLVFCGKNGDDTVDSKRTCLQGKGKILLAGCHPSSFVVLQVVNMHYLVLS